MHLNAKRPVFVPQEFWNELGLLSKAALMDLVWDFATTEVGEKISHEAITEVIRKRAAIVVRERKNA